MSKVPPAAATIDDYIAAFPRAVRTRLEALRRAIRAAAPDAVETISYRIPTFKQDGRALIYFAGYESHVGLYPVAATDSELAGELEPYASGKATLKFPLDQPLPLDLVARVVRAKLRRAAKPPARSRRAHSAGSNAGPLDVSFNAVLLRNDTPNGWTYVVWPKAAEFFGTKGLVKVEATVDGLPMTTSFMAMGDGRHMLPIKAGVRRAIGKEAGDRVKVELRARLR
jgi:uncharacterized protein YdhG (YjbR/CyaY superfamily)